MATIAAAALILFAFDYWALVYNNQFHMSGLTARVTGMIVYPAYLINWYWLPIAAIAAIGIIVISGFLQKK